jgi:predicted MFS family arabinose efflux permease
MVAVALALWWVMPRSRNAGRAQGYGQVLRSLGTLALRHPRLRSRALLGGLSFASVSVLFSTMALLLAGPAHRLGDAGIGLVGLAGVAGALMANVAGRMADRGQAQVATAVSVGLLLLGWGALWLGATSLVWFVVGMLVVGASRCSTPWRWRMTSAWLCERILRQRTPLRRSPPCAERGRFVTYHPGTVPFRDLYRRHHGQRRTTQQQDGKETQEGHFAAQGKRRL